VKRRDAHHQTATLQAMRGPFELNGVVRDDGLLDRADVARHGAHGVLSQDVQACA
jgi:hypothetical protein